MKSLKTFQMLIFTLSSLHFATPALAQNEKSFECNTSLLHGHVQLPNNPWSTGPQKSFTVATRAFNCETMAQTSQTLDLGNGYELVFDLLWRSGTAVADDGTPLKPSMEISARLQQRIGETTRVLALSSFTHSEPTTENEAYRKFNITSTLSDPQVYSDTLKDPHQSNHDMVLHAQKADKILKYELSCTTTF